AGNTANYVVSLQNRGVNTLFRQEIACGQTGGPGADIDDVLSWEKRRDGSRRSVYSALGLGIHWIGAPVQGVSHRPEALRRPGPGQVNLNRGMRMSLAGDIFL